MTDTNRAEPMKGLAEWLVGHANYLEFKGTNPAQSERLRRWAEEVEASRLPLVGAALSDEHKALRDHCWKEAGRRIEAEDNGLPYRPFPAPSDAAVQPVAHMVDIQDGLGTVFIEFFPGCRPPAGTKLYTSPLPTAPATELQAVEALVSALVESRGWMKGYAHSIVKDALDRTAPAGAREALELARPYVEAAIHRMYDGTNGQGMRDEAKRRLDIIDAALAAAPLDRIAPDTARLDWMFANCRIVYFPPANGGPTPYPIEHNPRALGYGNKRDSTPILQFADAAIEAEHGITFAPIAGKGDVNG